MRSKPMIEHYNEEYVQDAIFLMSDMYEREIANMSRNNVIGAVFDSNKHHKRKTKKKFTIFITFLGKR